MHSPRSPTFPGVFNLKQHPVDVTFEFFGTNGLLQTQTRRIAEGPGRFKVKVRDWLGATDHGTPITGRTLAGALTPIVAERTMSWQTDRRGGHSTPGQSALATNWVFAEGDSGYFATYFAVVNPHATGLPPVLAYHHRNGSLYWVGRSGPAQSRTTIAPAAWRPVGSFGVIIGDQSELAFCAERVMYGGPSWTMDGSRRRIRSAAARRTHRAGTGTATC